MADCKHAHTHRHLRLFHTRFIYTYTRTQHRLPVKVQWMAGLHRMTSGFYSLHLVQQEITPVLFFFCLATHNQPSLWLMWCHLLARCGYDISLEIWLCRTKASILMQHKFSKQCAVIWKFMVIRVVFIWQWCQWINGHTGKHVTIRECGVHHSDGLFLGHF